jgi:hypothetical protein
VKKVKTANRNKAFQQPRQALHALCREEMTCLRARVSKVFSALRQKECQQLGASAWNLPALGFLIILGRLNNGADAAA